MKRIPPVFFAIFLLTIAVAAQQRAIVSVEGALLRGTAQLIGVVVDTISKGGELMVYRTEGEWSLVQSESYVGWVRTDSIILITGPGKITPAAQLLPEPSEPASDKTVTGYCKDKTTTFAITKDAACANHGGVEIWNADWIPANRDATTTTQAPTNSTGTVPVKGYYRKDGTYVRPYTRSSPGSGRRKP